MSETRGLLASIATLKDRTTRKETLLGQRLQELDIWPHPTTSGERPTIMETTRVIEPKGVFQQAE